MTHTKDILAQELEKIGLTGMAAKAREGWYHDFLSPLASPCIQLSLDLFKVNTPEALALRARHHEGEFDASKEESDAWAESPAALEALQALAKDVSE